MLTSGGFPKAAIVVAAIFVVEPGACVVSVLVEAWLSDADAYVLSSEGMDVGELISPPLDAISPFPIITDV